MRDSIFSPILASFETTVEEIPYADDEPTLNRKTIVDALDETQDKFTNLLIASAWNETDKYLKKIEPALNKADRTLVEKEKWAIALPMQSLLYGLWTSSWGLGNGHAVEELNIKNKNRDFSKFTKRSDPVYIAYPPDYGIPLGASDLRSAVEQRTLKLANDVSDETAGRIQSYILDAVDTHKAAGGVPVRDRKLLLQRINGIIGRQRGQEVDRDIPPEERVKTKVGVPGTVVFHKRARAIAATELSAAYSLGRLQVYTQAKVKKVRWQALEDLKTCRICRSRNGTVHDLDTILQQHRFAYKSIYDPTQYVIPVHVFCRCHLQPLQEDIDEEDDRRSRDPGRDPKLRKIATIRTAWALAGTAVSVNQMVAAQQQQQQKQRQKSRARTRRNLFLGGTVALSLAALYLLLRRKAGAPQSQPQTTAQPTIAPQAESAEVKEKTAEAIRQATLNLRRQQQQRLIASLPVTPADVLPEELQNRYQRLLTSGVDLKAVTKQSLTNLYGVSLSDAVIIKALTKQYQQNQLASIPPASPTSVTQINKPKVIQSVGLGGNAKTSIQKLIAPQLGSREQGVGSRERGGNIIPTQPTPPTSTPTPYSPLPTPRGAVRPNRYQPPTVNPTLPMGSRELRQQDNRDRLIQGMANAEDAVDTYQGNITRAVGDAPAAGLRRGRRNPPRIGTALYKANQKKVEVITRVEVAKRKINNAVNASTYVTDDIEQSISQIEDIAQNINDPLATPYFNRLGNRSEGINRRLTQIDLEIKDKLTEITDAINSPRRETLKLENLKEELQFLKNEAATVLDDIASRPDSPLSLERSQLLQNLQIQLDSINNINPQDVGYEFGETLQGMRSQLTELIASQKDLRSSSVLTRIDSQLAEVETAISRMSGSRNATALSNLTESRARLLNLRDRVRQADALPRSINQLTEQQQSSWRSTQEARRLIQASSSSLDKSVPAYRAAINKQDGQIKEAQEKFDKLATDLEVPLDDGKSAYKSERDAAIDYNLKLTDGLVEESTELLNKLRLVTDPNVGIQYVMRSIKEADILDNLDKNISPADSTSALAKKKRVRETIGLDEAALIRREIISNLKFKLARDSKIDGVKNSTIKRIEDILKLDSPGNATKERLAAVDQSIVEWQELRDQTAFNSNRYAAQIRADLEKLRQADLIAYGQLNPNRLLEEIEYNAQFRVRAFEQKLTRLQNLRDRLIKDLNDPLLQERNLQLLEKVKKIKVEVQSLGKTRRSELDAVYRKVISSGVDVNKLIAFIQDTEIIRGDRIKDIQSGRLQPKVGIKGGYLGTVQRKKLFDSLNDEEWQVLVDAAQNGALSQFDDLGKLAAKKIQLEALASANWQDVQDTLKLLQQKTGYNLTLRLDPDGVSIKYIDNKDLVDIETNPNRWGIGNKNRPNPYNYLVKIRTLTGLNVGGTGSQVAVNLTKPTKYVDIQAALLANADAMAAIYRRLELLNFSKKLKLVEFKADRKQNYQSNSRYVFPK